MADFHGSRAFNPPVAAAMVIGGGIGGMRAALDLADAGLKVFLVEHTPCLGGRVAQLGYMFPQHDCVLCRGTPDHGYGCTRPSISPAYIQHNQHPNIHILTNTHLLDVAGQAGALQIQYPANVKFIRMPCSGKTDVRYLLVAFEQGADGVYVVACPIGNCHHVRGNERGRARLRRAKTILDEIGIDDERLDMFFMSGSQAHAFANAAQTMTERIRKLGPNPLKAKYEGRFAGMRDEVADEDVGFRGRRFGKQ